MNRRNLLFATVLSGCSATIGGTTTTDRCSFETREPLICTSATNHRIYARIQLGEEINLGNEYAKIQREHDGLILRVFDRNCQSTLERRVNVGRLEQIGLMNPGRILNIAIHNQGPIEGELNSQQIVVLAFTTIDRTCGRNCSIEPTRFRISGENGSESRIVNPTATFQIVARERTFEVYPNSPPREFIGSYSVNRNGGEADYQYFGLLIQREGDEYFAQVKLCNVF